MSTIHDRLRALERLRTTETNISIRVEILRTWLKADLQASWLKLGFSGAPPEFPPAQRLETWWNAPLQGKGPKEPDVSRSTFEQIEVLAQWLHHFDSAVADRALKEGRAAQPYSPGKGDGTPLKPVLERIFLDLWTAERLRAEAGINRSSRDEPTLP